MSEEQHIEIPKKIGQFDVVEKIGNGTFSSVYLGIYAPTNTKVAIKAIPKEKIASPQALIRFNREVNLLKLMDHPMVSQLFQVIENEHYHFLIQEYAENGDLLTFVNSHGRLIEPIARKYFIQLISVLDYLHNVRKVAHRDLKAENILLDKNHNIRLIDFGLSNSFNSDTNFSSACGSPAYVPPEMIRCKQYTNSCDIWSAGIFLYAITVGKLPFQDINVQKLLSKIVYVQPSYPSFLTPQLVDLISKMLQKEPENRITLEQIKQHPWFSPLEYSSLNNFVSTTCSTSGEFIINASVLQQMESLNIDTGMIKQRLFTRDFDDATAIYRMLLKLRIMDDMKSSMLARPVPITSGRVIPKTSTPQPLSKFGNSQFGNPSPITTGQSRVNPPPTPTTTIGLIPSNSGNTPPTFRPTVTIAQRRPVRVPTIRSSSVMPQGAPN